MINTDKDLSSKLIVSVVVIGHDEEARLERCLRSVQAMQLPAGKRAEIIYVDSASNDESPARAAALGAEVICLDTARPTAAKARNIGWRRARAPFVLFLDGDATLDPCFTRCALEAMAWPQAAVITGERREINPLFSFYNRALHIDWIGALGSVDFCGGNALIRRSVLEEVNGYDETLVAGEGPDMCTRMRFMKYEIISLDRPMTHHDLAISRWSQYWHRTVRAGHAYAEVARRFDRTSIPIWQRESRRNLVHAPMLIALLIAGCTLSFALHSLAPLSLVCALFISLVLRTTLRYQQKTGDLVTGLLHGIHSHIQQIPIFCGQLNYWYNAWRGKQQFIEYKENK